MQGDNAGASITITVNPAPVANRAPTATLSSPVSGTYLVAAGGSKTFSLSGSGSDPDGNLSKTDILVDGAVAATGTSTVSGSKTLGIGGPYSIYARATDSNGLTGNSSTASVTVKANTAPTASLTSPANGATYTSSGGTATVSVSGSGSDVDGNLTTLEIIIDGTSRSSVSAGTISGSFTLANGPHTISIRATDAFGAVTNSSAASITVVPPGNQAPTATITSPANNASITAGSGGTASVTVNGSAADSDGSISQLQLQVDSSAPVAFTSGMTVTLGVGPHQLKLIATDNQGATGSSTVSVTVPPAPTDGATYVSQSVINPMETGKPYTVSVTMRNSGTTTWTAGNLYRLGSQNPQDNSLWGLNRVLLDAPVAPNDTKTFTFTVNAPLSAGTYNFQWRMVRDQVGWFGDTTPNVGVTVNTATISASCLSSTPAGGSYTGATTGGTVWGNNVTGYTTDSNIAMAIVHAGLVSAGQSAQITVTPIDTQTSFTGSSANGVTSSSSSTARCGMRLSIGVAPQPTITVTRTPSTLVAGRSFITSWNTTNATSVGYSCTASGTGFNGTTTGLAPNGNGGESIASSAWIGYPSTCTWTATGPGGTKTHVETMTTVAPVDNAQFMSQSIPASMVAGQPYLVSVTMKNTGTTPWTQADSYKLGAQNPQDGYTWMTVNRVLLAAGETIAPQESKTFSFTVNAPTTPGSYNFQWKMVREFIGWFGDQSTNVPVTVTASSNTGLSATLSAASTNVRVTGGATAAVTFTGSGNSTTSNLAKVELLQSTPTGFKAVAGSAATSSTGAASLSLPAGAQTQNLAAGVYQFKLRSTDRQNNIADSNIVTVNVTNSSLLGTIDGVRIDAQSVPNLTGWVCQDTSTEALSYQLFTNAPSTTMGGTQVATGTANLTSDPANASVQAACHTPGSGHHFSINLNTAAAGVPAGTPLYVVANTSGGNSIVLPCGDNNCTMPGSLRIALSTPLDGDTYQAPATVFMRAVVANVTAPDEVAFSFNGQWVTAQADTAANTYIASVSNVQTGNYPVMAKVRKGNITVYSVVNTITVGGAGTLTVTLTSPTAGSTIAVGAPITLTATIAGTGTANNVKFTANGTLVGTATTGSNGVWSTTWNGAAANSYSIVATAYNSGGTQLAQSTPVSMTVGSGGPSSATPIAVNITPPHLGNPDAGTLPGSLNVGNDGAATYSIPIAVPPGTAGMQPSLSLNYSSLAGNGVAGYGWSLSGQSSVHRCIKTIAQDGQPGPIKLDSTDALCLDGQRLVLVTGVYGQVGSSYRTEIDNFSRITAIAGVNSQPAFKVETKGGHTMVYGSTADSAAKAVGKFDPVTNTPVTVSTPLFWALATEQDRARNTIAYEYQQDSVTGEHLLKRIRYGNNSALFNSVEFGYECRNNSTAANCTGGSVGDADIEFLAGARVDVRQRLKTITTKTDTQAADGSGGTLAQTTTLTYTTSAVSQRSLLQSVQVCSGAGACLPATTFAWGTNSGSNSFVSSGILSNGPFEDYGRYPPPTSYPYIDPGKEVFDYKEIIGRMITGDFAGDGKQHILTADTNGWHRYSINAAGTGFDKTDFLYANNAALPKAFFGVSAADANGMAQTPTGIYNDQVLTGDFDGDGISDVAFLDLNHYPYYTTASNQWKVCLSRPALPLGFDCRSFAQPALPQEVERNLRTMDTNADGRTDVVLWGSQMTQSGQRKYTEDKRWRYVPPTNAQLNDWSWAQADYPGVFGAIYNAPLSSITTDYNIGLANMVMDNAVIGRMVIGDLWGTGQNSLITQKHWNDGPGNTVLHSTMFAAVPNDTDFNTKPIGAHNQFAWTTGGDTAPVISRYWQQFRQFPMRQFGTEMGGTPLTDMNGDGYTDFLFTFAEHAEICYSVGLDGFDCHLMVEGTPAANDVAPDGSGTFGVFSLLSSGHVSDTNVNQAVYWRGGSLYAVCTLYDGQRKCSDWTGPQLRGPNVVLWSSPDQSIATKPNAGSLVGDYTGNGRMEILWYGNDPASAEGAGWQLFTPDSSGPTDRLVGVTNGLGARATVDYKPTTDASVYSLQASDGSGKPAYPLRAIQPGGRMLVAQLNVDKGDGVMLSTTYRYESLVTDVQGRGEQGFERVTITSPQGTRQSTRYAQGFPYTGMALDTKTTSSTGTVLEQTAYTPALAQGTVTRFPYIQKSEQLAHRDLDGSPLPLTTVRVNPTDIDAFGNTLATTATTVGPAGTDSAGQTYTMVTVNAYDNFPGDANYRIGELRSTAISKSAPGQPTVTRTTSFDYSTVADGIAGLLKTVTVEPADPRYKLATTYQRDSFGNISQTSQAWLDPVSQAAANRIINGTTYEPRGRFPYQVRNATCFAGSGACQSETRVYDNKTGAMTSLTGPNGLTTTWQVDGFGRIQKEIRADGGETRTYRKQCQGACGVPNATSVHITEHFNGSNRMAAPALSYIDSAGHVLREQTWGFGGDPVNDLIVTDHSYDDYGRAYQHDWPRYANAASVPASQTLYDELNRVIEVDTFDELGTTLRSYIFYQGLNTTYQNPKNQRKTDRRNPLDQLDKTTDALLGVTLFVRDAWGNLTQVTDPKGNVTTVKYDPLGRKTELIDPDLGKITYDVDPRGLQWRQISPNQRASGKATTFAYDLLDRMSARVEPDLESHWVYDQQPGAGSCAATRSCGQLVEAYTQTGVTKDYDRLHSYDSLGRPSNTATVLDVVYNSSIQYDAWGRLIATGEQRNNGAVKLFERRYNKAGYLARIERGSLVLWAATKQDAANRVTKATLGNGLTVDRDYNANTGRLSQGTLTSAQQTQQLLEGYFYDALGNVSTRTQSWANGSASFSEIFGYDGLNRLTSSQVSGQPVQNFTYDGTGSSGSIGNITSKTGVGTYTYSAGPGCGSTGGPHAVKCISGLGSFSYDPNGNMLDGAGRTLTWTSFDMPQSITKGGQSSTFVYGPEHQRTRQIKTGSVASTIRYAGAMEIETAGNSTTVKTYWPQGLGVEIDKPGASSTELNWTHVDRLGSVIAISDQNGVLKEKLEYDAWGKRRTIDGSSTPDSLDGQVDNKGFTGHEMLDQLDLVHMNGRVYDPLVARFVSGDPIIQDPEHSQSYNRYTYVWNNPTNLTDPTGFLTEKEEAAAQAKKEEAKRRDEERKREEAKEREKWEKLTPSGKARAHNAYYSGRGNGYTDPKGGPSTTPKGAASSGGASAGAANSGGISDRDAKIREGMLASPNPATAQTAACAGHEGACVVVLGTPLAGGWLTTTLLGRLSLPFIALNLEANSDLPVMAPSLGLGPSAIKALAAKEAGATLKTTAHGAVRIAGAGATRGGVLSAEGVQAVREGGRVLTQADGAIVRILQTESGRFNVVVEGERGIITTFENLSQKTLDRLSKNYGWH